MKSNINKFLLGGCMAALLGATSCVGDLDQFPKDETVITPDELNDNAKEYVGACLAKCYSGIAVSGQTGAGSSDISGLDNGLSCWSRAIFILNEFTTDECAWIWKDAGIFDLVTDTWSTNNVNIFGTYSRLYTHVAICNEFLRLIHGQGTTEVDVSSFQGDADQFSLEARALRDLSYFYILDLFGNAALAWDDQAVGEAPVPTSRAALFEKVTADLEDVLARFPNSTPIYGRIGKDAVEALLAKFYLNAEQWTGTAQWQKCWQHCQNIIARHGSESNNYGLAKDYLSLFCGNNDMFAPGGSLTDQNEILWNIPYQYRMQVWDEKTGKMIDMDMTQSYGGTSFLILAALSDKNTALPGWFGINGQWTCMRARPEFSEKFDFSSGVSQDGRTYLWITDGDGHTIENTEFTNYQNGYVPVKFSNVLCEADGTMPKFEDPESGLNRAGVHTLTPVLDADGNPTYYKNGRQKFTVGGIDASATFANTDYPVIRLAEILLTAAEAHVRGGVGSQTEALSYVNAVRRRAGVTDWNNAQLSQVDNLLDERARELYWENCRRTDLVRFGKFAGNAYNWSWKQNVPEGAGMPSYMNLFPIPTSVINSYNMLYPQNPGY